MKYFYPYFFLTLFFFFLFAGKNLFAKWQTSAPLSRVHQIDGPVEAGDVNQKLLKIVMTSTNPPGSSTINSLGFDLTGNTEIASIKVVYTTASNDSNFANATNQFGATITSPGTSISISGSYTAPTGTGTFFFWLVCTMKGAITNGVNVDASLTSFSGGSTPIWENGALPIAPTGFRFTSRNYKIGTGEQYPTILETANGISRFDYDGAGDIIMEMTANYANPIENARITFSEHIGPATIIIRPQAGQTSKITQGNPGSDIEFILFSGAQKIILDGRPGGIGIDREWTFRNSLVTAPIGPVFNFANDATNDTLRFLNIMSETNPSINGIGIIHFSNPSPVTGNDNNAVLNCKISDLSGGTGAFPNIGVSSLGLAGKGNNNITIKNCEFVDIFKPSLANSANIFLGANNGNWTIVNNHFYQTTSFSGLTTNAFSIINITSGGGYVVSENFIGGTAPNCSGTAYIISSGTAEFYGIVIGVSVTGAILNINGNTISNLQYTTTMTSSVYPMGAINLNGSANINCGVSGNGNIIGGSAGANNIILTNNSGSGSLGFIGIYQNSSGTTSIAYNTFSGIIVNGTKPAASSHLIQNFAGTTTVDNNTFGTFLNNISVSSNSDLFIIRNAAANGITCTNNTFDAISHNATTAGFGGIFNVAGNLTATGNTFQNISSSSNSSNGAFFMIDHEPSGAGVADIQNNTIQDINLSSTGTTVKFFGLSINTATNGNICSNNTIGSTTNNNITLDNNAFNYAIYHSLAGTLICNNNTIQEFNLTSAGTNASFFAINNASGAGTLSATGNTIKNIDLSTAFNFGDALIGINNLSNASGHLISGNSISNLNLFTATSTNIHGIFSNSTGTGDVKKNMITGLTNNSTDNTSIFYGIRITSGTAWNINNNVVLLDNAPNTNDIQIEGISVQNGGAGSTYSTLHNTVKISGTISSGVTNSMCYEGGNAAGTDVVKNNLFQNLRTGGTGVYYTEYANSSGTYTTDFNYLEASDPNKVAYKSGTAYNLAGWQGAPVNATNSISGTITLDAIGKVSTDPFPGAGTGTNLTATVPDDKNDITRGVAPWMGSFEGANITTSAISPLSICAGGAIGVSYTVGGGDAFNGGNIFTAELSDASGSFTSPTAIGTLASTTSGTIAATIPGGTPVGSAYRIRVVSSAPVVTGSDNGANIDIATAAPSAPAENSATGVTCSGFTANWAASTGATTYFLDVAEDAGFTIFVPGYNNLDVGNVTSYNITGLTAGTTYYYRMRAANGCGTSANSGVKTDNTSGTQQTYMVTSTANSGAGTLNQAIADANANCGHDIINFNLGAAIPYTISLTAALPDLTDPDGVTIDGFENGANDGTPNGIPVFNATTGTPMNPNYAVILGNNNNIATGLALASDNNIIKGLVLQNFGDGTPDANDIAITINGNNNKILGCNIGMDATGTTRGTKTAIGILVTGANNSIGNGTAAGANLISGMNGLFPGITFTTAGASANTIKGNMIGLQKDGSTVVTGAAQSYGVKLTNLAYSNTIGGSFSDDGNVISGNNSGGVLVDGIFDAANNTIIGNIIGPQADGATFVTSNSQDYGVEIYRSPNNTIGGNTAGARNIISANEQYGVYITGAGSTGNVVKGNYIGIDKNGTSFITSSTQDYGVYFLSTSGGSNTIGGSGAGEGNVISGNNDGSASGVGIYLASTAAAGNTVIGNIIGPQADGLTYLASNPQGTGISITNSPNNIIGGSTAGERNVISANGDAGVYLANAGSTGNIVKGNYIGIDKNGTTFITGSTQDYGVYIELSAASNTIGGSSTGEGNVISGNSNAGVYLNSSAANGNAVLGNIIGTQQDGNTYLASNPQLFGVEIINSINNIVGGNTAGARNIISGNETIGVYFLGALGCSGNIIKGNYIGIAKNGTSFITGSTQNTGIYIANPVEDNTIGGSGAGEGNVISGNSDGASTGRGIYLLSGNSAGTTVLGNIIGPQEDGITYLSSNAQYRGIEINGSPNNVIGGNTAGARNIISANEYDGVFITGAGSTGNVVKGNYIGIDKTGTSFITGSTQDIGVLINSTAASNTIGGSGAGEGNVISGNKDASSTGNGISLFGSDAAGNTVLGNIIGTQADGITYLASNAQFNGIYVLNSPNNTIGGNTAAAKNIISANETYGLYISGASSTGNVVKGNYIGTSSTLANITSSSQDYGVYITSSAASNTVGSTAAGEANEIAFNTVNGVYIIGTSSTGNIISANPVYSNTGKPIELNYGPSQANNGIAVPLISTATPTTVSGNSGATDVIEVFKNTTGDCFDAATYVGSATAAGGLWSLTGLSLAQGEYVLATATDGSNNTSEFSSCSPVIVDRYWVGGNAMWNNPANWSASSGGAGGAGVPDINSNVFIDNNSGIVTITMPVGAWYTKAFTMSGNGAKAQIIGQGSLLPRP